MVTVGFRPLTVRCASAYPWRPTVVRPCGAPHHGVRCGVCIGTCTLHGRDRAEGSRRGETLLLQLREQAGARRQVLFELRQAGPQGRADLPTADLATSDLAAAAIAAVPAPSGARGLCGTARRRCEVGSAGRCWLSRGCSSSWSSCRACKRGSGEPSGSRSSSRRWR
jgi:hypothetical protein